MDYYEDSYPRRNLHGQIVHEIGLRIVRGDLLPGDPLPTEDGLCAELGVSRTVVREAVKVLAGKGLLESRPKTGTRVRPRNLWNLLDTDVLLWESEAGPDEKFLRNLIQVRRIIEPAAAELAAMAATGEEIARIDEAFNLMHSANDEQELYITADMQFHAAIFSACGNELLEQMASAIGVALRVSRKITVQIPGGNISSLPLHWAVLEAIRTRDPEAARVAMQTLIDQAGADIERVLNKTRLLA